MKSIWFLTLPSTVLPSAPLCSNPPPLFRLVPWFVVTDLLISTAGVSGWWYASACAWLLSPQTLIHLNAGAGPTIHAQAGKHTERHLWFYGWRVRVAQDTQDGGQAQVLSVEWKYMHKLLMDFWVVRGTQQGGQEQESYFFAACSSLVREHFACKIWRGIGNACLLRLRITLLTQQPFNESTPYRLSYTSTCHSFMQTCSLDDPH